jgi:hypothetical protein
MRMSGRALASGVVWLIAACGDTSGISGIRPVASTVVDAMPRAAVVSRVVLVGMAGACACMRTRTEAASAVLEKTLGNPPRLPVERIALDTERERAEPYRRQQPLSRLPAIYFVDAEGGVVSMLEGEVTGAQIEALIGARARDQ